MIKSVIQFLFVLLCVFNIHGLRLEKSKITFGINRESYTVDRVSLKIVVAYLTFRFRFIIFPGLVPMCRLGTNFLPGAH